MLGTAGVTSQQPYSRQAHLVHSGQVAGLAAGCDAHALRHHRQRHSGGADAGGSGDGLQDRVRGSAVVEHAHLAPRRLQTALPARRLIGRGHPAGNQPFHRRSAAAHAFRLALLSRSSGQDSQAAVSEPQHMYEPPMATQPSTCRAMRRRGGRRGAGLGELDTSVSRLCSPQQPLLRTRCATWAGAATSAAEKAGLHHAPTCTPLYSSGSRQTVPCAAMTGSRLLLVATPAAGSAVWLA